LSVKEDGRIELSLKQAENQEYTKPPKQEREHSHMPAVEYLGEPPNMNFLDDHRSEEFDLMFKMYKRYSEENLLDNKRNIERKRNNGDKKKAKLRRGR